MTGAAISATRAGRTAGRVGYRLQLIVVALGLSALAIGLGGVSWAATSAGRLYIAGWLAIVVGGGVTVAGAASMLFAMATNHSLEWFVAWRYLQRGAVSRVTLFVGIGMLVAAAAVFAVSVWVAPDPIGGIAIEVTTAVRALHWVALGMAVAGWLVVMFGGLMLSFSVFTAISIYGVHLGTAALVVVLSVMGGFEQDLRAKILGTRAHVVVTKPKRMFSNYRAVLREAASVPGVAAVSPYLESEVMVTSQTNLEGVLLRGIDPANIGSVTQLRRYMKAEGGAGSLENLIHPERLAEVPAIPLSSVLLPPTVAPPKAADAAAEDQGVPADDAGAAGFGDERDRLEIGSDEQIGPKGDKDLTAKGNADTQVRPARPVYPGVIVGAELARNLRLYIGDDVNLVAPLGGMSPAGPIPKSRPFRVAGVFYSGMYEFDTKFAYVMMNEAQRFLGLDDEITGIEIKAKRVEDAGRVARTLARRLGNKYEVRDWQQLNRNLFSALKLEKLVMFIVLTFIVLVASFSIVTNLIMVVLEKGKEIATLKSIGATSWSVLRVFLYAGFYIGAIGMLMGVVEGVAICTYLAHVGLPLDPEVYYISRLPVRLEIPDIVAVALAGVALSFLATVYPALRAARLAPVEGLRYEG